MFTRKESLVFNFDSELLLKENDLALDWVQGLGSARGKR